MKPRILQLGVYPAVLESIVPAGLDSYYVYGQNFTASSRLEVNEELADTTYLGPDQLLDAELYLEDGDLVDIATQSNSSTKRVLSRTDSYYYYNPAAGETEARLVPAALLTPRDLEGRRTGMRQRPVPKKPGRKIRMAETEMRKIPVSSGWD